MSKAESGIAREDRGEAEAKAKRIAECEQAVIKAVELEQNLEERYAPNFDVASLRVARKVRRQAVDALREARRS